MRSLVARRGRERNPFAIVVPCHRVVAADGKLGGFSANGGVTTKLRLLAIEGAPTNSLLPLFDGDDVPDSNGGPEPRDSLHKRATT
jgi:hypothetical protein